MCRRRQAADDRIYEHRSSLAADVSCDETDSHHAATKRRTNMAATKRFTGIPATRGSSPGTSSAAVSGSSKARKNEPQDGTWISIARKWCVLSSDVRRRRSQRPITLSPGEAMSRTAVWKRACGGRCRATMSRRRGTRRTRRSRQLLRGDSAVGVVARAGRPVYQQARDALAGGRHPAGCDALRPGVVGVRCANRRWERLDHDQARTAWPQLMCLLKG